MLPLVERFQAAGTLRASADQLPLVILVTVAPNAPSVWSALRDRFRANVAALLGFLFRPRAPFGALDQVLSAEGNFGGHGLAAGTVEPPCPVAAGTVESSCAITARRAPCVAVA